MKQVRLFLTYFFFFTLFSVFCMRRVVQNNLSSLCTAHQITKYFINTCWLYLSICLTKRIMLIGSRYTQVYLFFTAQKIKYIVLMASRYTGTLLRRTLSRWNCVSDRVIQSISVMCSPCVLCSLKWTPSKDTCWPGNIDNVQILCICRCCMTVLSVFTKQKYCFCFKFEHLRVQPGIG